MKKYIVLVLFSCIIPQFLFAQWNLIYNHSDIEHAISAINKDTVITATEDGSGRMHYTYDGGQTWHFYQTQFTYSWFFDMCFPTSQVGYACGGTAFGQFRNVIIKTTNAGLTWDSLTANGFPGFEFSNVYFLNKDTGFIGSKWMLGKLLKTTDGGQNFSFITLPDTDVVVNDIYFTQSNIGFISTFRSINSQTPPYVVNIMRTTNLGATWATVYADTVNGANSNIINLFDFANNQIGYAVGNNGTFLKTTDGGLKWTKQKIPPYSNLTDISFTSANVGYINNAGSIYKTTDGGQSWTVQTIFPLTVIRKIAFANANIGFAIGDMGVYKTTNGGGTIGIKKQKTNLAIKVFPNPASSILHIAPTINTQIMSVEIFSLDGRKVYANSSKNKQTVYVSGLPAGTYCIGIKTEEGTVIKKIIVQ